MIKKIFKFLVFSSLLAIVFVYILGFQFYRFLVDPLTIGSNGYVLTIPPGTSVQKIARLLSKEQLIESPYYFLMLIHWQDAWGTLKAGEYFIKPGTKALDLIEQLQEGRVIQHALTIVPGWNFSQLLTEVHMAPKLAHTLQGLTPEEIMTKLGYPGEHPEGRFFPETYYFPAGTTDVAFLKRAYNMLQVKLNTLWEKRSTALPLKTPYEALILASIIEKETCDSGEYTEIAGVYVRRLKRRMPLQADPTVIYGMGKEYTGPLNAEMLKSQTPYNTYRRVGLPPTPIALVSSKALEAALNPKPGDTLYFVANKEGTGHVFSKTLKEHNAAVAKYKKSLTGNVLNGVSTVNASSEKK